MVQVFDVHVHLACESGERELFRVPARSEHVVWVAQGPVRHATTDGYCVAIQPPSYYGLTHGLEDTCRLNDLIGAVTRSMGERAAIAIGTVEPHHGEHALAEIDRMANELGFAGISWRARSQGVFADVPIMSAFIGRAADRGLVPMLHATPRSGNEALWRIWRLAEQFPSVPIVVLGALSEWDHQQAIMAEPDRAQNVVYDLSGLFGETEQIATYTDRLGIDRLVFGSGTYCDRPVDGARAAALIADSALGDPIKRAVLWHNAARVFGITGAAT